MSKTFLIYLFLLFNHGIVLAQGCPIFDILRPCQLNVNTDWDNFNRANDIKRAVVKYFIPGEGGCTGTLVNTTDHRQLLLTASHCINKGKDCKGQEWVSTYQDENNKGVECEFSFNYQSPDSYTSSTFESNKGCSQLQSFTLNGEGFEYFHKSYVRLLYKEECKFGDMTLLEIMTPIPPQFNPYYAGWTPAIINPPPFEAIHHPRGDVKKISETPVANPIVQAVGCQIITQIIDVFLGFLFGHSYNVSTQVICNYVESPFYSVNMSRGAGVESGSSGSGLFNHDNQLVATCSASLDWIAGPCSDIRDNNYYGKFRNQYHIQNLKQQLNPSNDFIIDNFGMQGWQRTAYNSLENLKGTYFPASHYQTENKIKINSASIITTNNNIVLEPLLNDQLRILSGADYEFNATNSITLNSGFEVEREATFEAKAGVTSFSALEQEVNPVRGLVGLPVAKEFAFEEAMKMKHYESKDRSVLPNPMGSSSILTWNNPNNLPSAIKIVDVSGKVVREISKEWGSQIEIQRDGLEVGFYFIVLQLEDGTKYTRKLVVGK